MKIIHLCLACFYIEGLEYQENVLPRKHKQLGYDVKIIASQFTFDSNGVIGEREAGEYMNTDNIPVKILPYSKNKYSRIFNLYDGLFDTLLSEAPDIIFIHGPQFASIMDVVKYKKEFPNVKVFVDQHGDKINSPINTLKKRIIQKCMWGYFARKISKCAEIIWGVTPSRVKYLIDVYKVKPEKTGLLVMGGDEDKIRLIDQASIRNKLRKNNNIDENDFLIITGGKIDKKKNIHLLMKAVSKLPCNNIHLVVFGQANADMQNEINELSNDKRITYIGWIQSELAYDWFLASDLAVFPGTHSVLWEQAVACGIPCVFKYWEGMDHVNVGGNCLFLYDESVDEISKMLLNIIENKEIYNNMKRIALDKGVKEFSYIEIAKRSINL
jgi:1,2-diacylglycerol 3-alpha-glucosyltransferase